MTDKVFLKDGHVPMAKGHQPPRVQGGYIPTSSIAPKPPSGGSAVTAPPTSVTSKK